MEKFEFSQPIKNEAFAEQNAKAIEKWDREIDEIRQLKSKIIEEADQLKESGIIDAKYGSFYYVQNLIVPELEKIAGQKEYKEYAASHIFIGSSTTFDKTPRVDLPGREIYNFSNELLEKFHTANEIGRLEI